MSRFWFLLIALASLVTTPAASARGGHYTFIGGSSYERRQVAAALAVSRFDWNVVPAVVVKIAHGSDSRAEPGTVYLDADLLDSGSFSWAVVQHEFGHQLDFSLLTDPDRSALLAALGASAWWGQLPHQDRGGERFATMMSVAYWPSRENCYYPFAGNRDAENSAITPLRFRTIVARLLAATQNPAQAQPPGP